MNYTAKRTAYRHFELYDDRDTLIGILDYPSWYRAREATVTAGNKTYDLNAVGFFRSSIEVTLGGATVATIRYNWRTSFEIVMENGTVYRFKRTSIWGSSFGLYDNYDHQLTELITKFQLLKFSFSYTFRTDDNYAECNSPLLLALMLYTLNDMRNRHAAVV